ncbi:MAG: 3-hydroxyacyl-CoA dehydrogenase NAD-binding domain-containing protein [Actinomycetota bacterium]|nr:3-hydroxyacyl-CoA dehydrogenase NAD-binding domain-containing protein [Actinomycetota bacterium]
MYERDVRTAAVVGAGQMGHGIALVFARAGMQVRLIDVREDALHRAGALMASSRRSSSSWAAGW